MVLRLVAALCLAVPLIAAPSLLVLNKEDATLSIIDPASGKTLANVPTGEGPHEIAVSADGRFAYVGNYGARTPGNTISIVDLGKRGASVFDISPLQRPHGIHVGADGKVYFTAETNKIVARYDPASNRIDWMIGTGQNTTHMVMLTKDMNRMVTANIASDTMTIMDRVPGPVGWNATVIPVGKGPEGFDVSPDGRELWAANSRDGSISIVDLSSKKVAKTVDVQTKRSNRLKFTPDGKLVLVSDLESGDLIVLDAASRQERKRMKLGRAPEGILIQPDGSRAYIAISGENRVDVLDLKTLEVADHIKTGRGPDGMAWVEIR